MNWKMRRSKSCAYCGLKSPMPTGCALWQQTAKEPLLPGDWDMICGSVANDQTMPVIDLFLDGMYDEEETIKRLLPQKLKDQFVLKTETAIRLLRCREVIRL